MAAKTVLNYLPRKSVVHQLTGTNHLSGQVKGSHCYR